MRRRLASVALAALAPLVAGCELQEVVLAQTAPFVVVESYLTASDVPRVAIHAATGAPHLTTESASVLLIGAGDSVPMWLDSPDPCLAAGVVPNLIDFPGGLACYVPAFADLQAIMAGELYRLEVRLEDGSRLSGTTRVPEQVVLHSDSGAGLGCYLPPWTQLELAWTPAAGAAAFVLDLRAFGVAEALAREGIEADVPDPLILRGLAIGNQDTTIVLPREFGLFDRFMLDANLLVALQRGIPEGVVFEVVVAAVDQNFVGWARGGDFNPSGLTRVPSMFGDAGTGVLGSLSTDRFTGSTSDENSGERRCGT